MNTLDLNNILNRNEISHEIKKILSAFDASVKDVNFKKGIYIYGSPGTGKTHFATALLKETGYDIIKYDAGDVRNKTLIDTITSNNVSSCNVLDLMRGKIKKIAIIMDEIDGMHKGDKGGISALVKLIRQKKTKKQKLESVTLNPIICIGNYYTDKKIKELMKVCHTFELKTPEPEQTRHIIDRLMPKLENQLLIQSMVDYIQGDIRKIEFLYKLYNQKPDLLSTHSISTIFHTKLYNDDYGKITKQLFSEDVAMEKHNTFMNDNDRTTVALLWHENIVDRLSRIDRSVSLPFYLDIVDNICFADYMDRITFQNQIWIFNEMSSLVKTFYNNRLYHRFAREHAIPHDMGDMRFTKILTKYSTEYSNTMFLYMLCQELDMDKKDATTFFQEIRLLYGQGVKNGHELIYRADILNDVERIFQDTKIKRLDIKRMYRYLDKNVKKDMAREEDDDDDYDDDGMEEEV
jgi:DNA polymerase III delta prime subunit